MGVYDERRSRWWSVGAGLAGVLMGVLLMVALLQSGFGGLAVIALLMVLALGTIPLAIRSWSGQHLGGCFFWMVLATPLILLVAYQAVIVTGVFVVPSIQLELEERGCEEIFDRELWLDVADWEAFERSGRRVTARHCMADLLLEGGTLRGQSRHDLAELLGEPSWEDAPGGWDQAWLLGVERHAMGFEDEYLAVRFDEADRVVEAALRGW